MTREQLHADIEKWLAAGNQITVLPGFEEQVPLPPHRNSTKPEEKLGPLADYCSLKEMSQILGIAISAVKRRYNVKDKHHGTNLPYWNVPPPKAIMRLRQYMVLRKDVEAIKKQGLPTSRRVA